MPKTTIVTPTLGRPTLVEALNSTRGNRLDGSAEHIVVFNNCEPQPLGGTGIVAEYVDAPADYGNTARIHAFKQARGEYIATLDDDDRYESLFIDAMTDVLDNTPEVDVVYCRSYLVDKASGEQHGTYLYPWNPQTLDTTAFILSPTIMFRRKIIDAGIYPDPNDDYAADWFWYRRMVAAGYRFASVDVPLANSRVENVKHAVNHWAPGGWSPTTMPAQFHRPVDDEVTAWLRQRMPDLFTSRVLYIGAHPQAAYLAAELKRPDLLEPWYPNLVHFRYSSVPVFRNLRHEDVRNLKRRPGRKPYDFAFWHQGPEHVSHEEAVQVFQVLKTHCNTLIVATPHGEYPQGEAYGNPLERHVSTWYPDDFNDYGFATQVFGGGAGDPNATLLAWK